MTHNRASGDGDLDIHPWGRYTARMGTPVAQVLFMARRLRAGQRLEFVRALAKDRTYRAMIEDAIDGRLIDARRNEPGRLLSEYLSDRTHRKPSRT